MSVPKINWSKALDKLSNYGILDFGVDVLTVTRLRGDVAGIAGRENRLSDGYRAKAATVLTDNERHRSWGSKPGSTFAWKPGTEARVEAGN